MILRYGKDEHGAIDMNFIIHIAKPSKCTLIYDTLGNMHTFESSYFEHNYIMKKWIDFKNKKKIENNKNN